MKRILVAVVVLCACSAYAAAPPPQVFGELAVAPIDREIAAWNAVVLAAGAPSAPLEHDQVLANIAKALDFPVPDGTDLRRPLSVVVTDPRGRAHPFLLTLEVADESKFAIATQGLPTGIAVRRQKRVAVLGDPELLRLVGDYALTRLREAPKDGLRARVFIAPVWAAFGAQAAMLRAVLVGQPKSSTGIPPETTLQLFDAVISGAQQVSELQLEAHAGPGGSIDAPIRLIAIPGSNIDHFIARQKPSDFSMLSQMPDLPFSYIGAGHIDMTGEPGFSDWIFGPPKDDQDRITRAETLKISAGELAMSNQVITSTQMAARFLIRAPAGVTPTKAIVLAMFNAMSGSALLGGMTKMVSKALPASVYDGLTINNDQIDVDMGQLARTPETAHIKQSRAWTMWGNLIASVTSDHAATELPAVLDAARHGTKTWKPNAEQSRALEGARAAKESFAVFFDPKAMDVFKTDKSASQLNLGTPACFIGFGGHQGWLRFRMGGARN